MNIISSDRAKYPATLFLILSIGLLLRVLFISVHERPLISDEKEYDQLAYNLTIKASYTYGTSPTAYRPIGYPAILGSIYYLFGHHLMLVRLLQALADVGIAFVIYLLLAGHPDRMRVLGATLWVAFAPAVFYSNLLLSETFFTVLLVISAWMLTKNDQWKTSQCGVLGTLLGMLTLIKPAFILLALCVPLITRKFQMSHRNLYPIAVGFMLVLSPWIVRNYLTFGEFALSSNGGINLLIGNNPEATGAYKYPTIMSNAGGSKGEFEFDHEALRSAVGFITMNPLSFALNAAKKIGRLFESEGGILVMTFHDSPEDASIHYGAKYASLPLPWILLTNLFYFVIMLAAVFGFLSAERGRLWWISLATLITWLVVHALFFGGGRFHFPLMPLMVAFAAQFLYEPAKRLKSLSPVRTMLAYSVAAILCVLWFIEGNKVFNG